MPETAISRPWACLNNKASIHRRTNKTKAREEARKKQEEAIKGLIDVAIVAHGWVNQAHHELEADIARKRVGWLKCQAYDLNNKITPAEDYHTTLLSDRVEVVLKYNVSSY